MSKPSPLNVHPVAIRKSEPGPDRFTKKADLPLGGTDARPTAREEIWLLGQPPLADFLDYVRKVVVGGVEIDRATLADEWRAANDYYCELERREAGIADEADCLDLDPALAPLVDAVMADDRYKCTFDTLPTTFAMVELDRLMVYQKHVTRQFAENLAARLVPPPSPEALFRFCLPLDRDEAPIKISRIGSRRYTFRSESSDLRFHEAVLLKPAQIRNYATFGPIGGVLGLVVGFGSNFLNVIRSDNRLLLNNGYHRAYAMRAVGITHAPCIVRTVTRRDELELVASSDVCDNPTFYFRAARPPLLKDFFDPRIRRVLPVPRLMRMIEVNFEVRDFEIAE
jgi:hypothetical protein